ncbi:MAG: hypothetical protein JO182_30420, partial [Acidobacteriaceae bacterium]|nr:hypothetical protein [Acidobacteriaceae bacterium]
MLSSVTFCLLCGCIGLSAVSAFRRGRSRLPHAAGCVLLRLFQASLLVYPILASAQSTDVLYVLGTDAKLWRETGSYQNRSLVDSNVVAFQALDATTVYVLGTNGYLWRETGNYQNRSLVDADVDFFQALDA